MHCKDNDFQPSGGQNDIDFSFFNKMSAHTKKPRGNRLGLHAGLTAEVVISLQGLTECDVEADVQIHIGLAHGKNLGSDAEGLVVAAVEEVEAFGVEVEHPAER